MRTPSTISPYSLLQEEIFAEAQPYYHWRMMVVCMMLNQTTAKQVRGVMGDFFSQWRTPFHLASAHSICVADAVRTLGLQNRRAAALIRMSSEFVAKMDSPHWLNVNDVYGLGKYALDSWRIFVDRDTPFIKDVDDKELKHYVRWARQQKKEKACQEKTTAANSQRA